MTEATGHAGNFCYRHPDRQSFVLCQRCGRTICPECQTQAAVGVHCPECVRESRASAPKTKSRFRTAFRPGSGRPVVTLTLIALCVVVFLLQLLTGVRSGPVSQTLLYHPILTLIEPWRIITSVFAHGSIFHLAFNMYTLYIFGQMLEDALGRARFLTLYLLAGFGGSVAVLLLAPGSAVLGASGAIFGLMGAFVVIQRGLGGQNRGLLVILGLNLVFPLLVPGSAISWQAHVGGLVVGAALGLIFMKTRAQRKRALQIGLIAAVAVALVALVLVRFFVIG
jgi:membrane associated rhomboid family serine protease